MTGREERKAFVKWADRQTVPGSNGTVLAYLTYRVPKGRKAYNWPVTEHAWQGWRARARLQADVLRELVAVLDLQQKVNGYVASAEECEDLDRRLPLAWEAARAYCAFNRGKT
jgi:hypothetical protein